MYYTKLLKRHLKEQQKKRWKKKVGTSAEEFGRWVFATEVMASQLELSKKYKQQTRQAQFEGIK